MSIKNLLKGAGVGVLILVLGAAAAYAAADQGTNINCLGDLGPGGFVYGSDGKTPLAKGNLVQIIDSVDNKADAPNPDGSLSDSKETVLLAIAVGEGTDTAGTFYKYLSAAAHNEDHYLYIRAWNAAKIADAAYYGDSEVKLIDHGAPPAPMSWDVADFSVNKPKPSGVTPPTITTSSLSEGTVGIAYSAALAASGGKTPYAWSKTSGSLPDGLSLSSSGTISGTPSKDGPFSFTVQVTDANSQTASKSLSIKINPAPVPEVDVPTISSILPASADIGQTLVLSGTKFNSGTLKEVWFNGVQAKPTQWSDTSITVAVPSGISSGDATVSVVTGDTTKAEKNITVTANKIYLDDFEGGSTGDWVFNKNSGYYVFDKYDKDYNPNKKSTSYPDQEIEKSVVKDGSQALKVLYSYGNRAAAPNYIGADKDWGGGWGAALANTLDLSKAKGISFYVKWDGSTNGISFALKDKSSVEAKADISNATLLLYSTGYGKVTIPKANFSADGFDWSNVINYNLVYNTKAQSSVHHYVDSISAYLVDEKEEPIAQEVEITSTSPYAAPAGTLMKINGKGFGDAQGQSKVLFENSTNKASYQADEVSSWSSGTVEVFVPRLAKPGTYTIKVIKVAIASGGGITAQESNPSVFKITASAANEGGSAVLYPNPFNPNSTGEGAEAQAMKTQTIAYNPGTATNIGIYIYDMTARLVYKEVTAASQVTWDGIDKYGSLVGDGAYILRIIDEDSKRLIAKGKILVIK